MRTIRKITVISITVCALTVLGGCSNMSRRDKNTAVGAGIGAVAGAMWLLYIVVVSATEGHDLRKWHMEDADRRSVDEEALSRVSDEKEDMATESRSR